MMQVDFNKMLTKFDGTDLINPEGNPTSLGWSVQEVLMSAQGGDQSASGKIKRVRIALQIDKTPVQEISDDEIQMFLKLAEGHFGPLVYYRMVEILDPKQLDATPKE